MMKNAIPKGLEEIAGEIPLIMTIIARTSRWVHPETFNALPVWRPEMARKAQLYKSGWIHPAKNKGLRSL